MGQPQETDVCAAGRSAIDCLLIDNVAQREKAVIAGWSQVVQLSVLANSKVFFLFHKEPHLF